MEPSTSISRRRFLARAGMAGAAAVFAPALAACSTSSKQLTFQNWTNYIAPDLLKGFQTQTGIAVSYETYVSNDQLASRLLLANSARRGGRSSRTFDLMVPSDNFVRQFREQGLVEAIDPSDLTNLGNLDPAFRHEGFDPDNRYTVPWATGTTGIGYDTTVFSTPPDYTVFLDDRYRGKMTMLDEVRDAYGAALFSLGFSPNTTSAAEINAATNQLIRMKKVIKGFDSTNYLQGLASGELVAAHAYNGDLLQAKETNPKLAFVLPAAGALRWVDSLAVPVHAPSPANAVTFMNYYLQAKVSASNSNFIRYDTGNQAALPLLDPAVRDNPVIFPPAAELAKLQFTVDLGGDERLYTEGWRKVQKS